MARVKTPRKTTARKTATKSTEAKNNPVIKTNAISSDEMEVAPEKTVEFAQDGTKQLIGSDIEVQSIHGLDEKARKLAFLEEYVTVNFQEGDSTDSEKYVILSINGIGAGPNGTPYVLRGVDVRIKRKYLGVASGARQIKYKNHEKTNPEGVQESYQKAYSVNNYPFTVIEDTREGLEWLKLQRMSNRA